MNSSKPKFYKEVKAPPNSICLRYGKCEGEDDIVAAHGEGCNKSDGNLLLDVFTSGRYIHDFDKGWTRRDSFIEELENRGYDT